jgi:hypothetical protein
MQDFIEDYEFLSKRNVDIQDSIEDNLEEISENKI